MKSIFYLSFNCIAYCTILCTYLPISVAMEKEAKHPSPQLISSEARSDIDSEHPFTRQLTELKEIEDPAKRNAAFQMLIDQRLMTVKRHTERNDKIILFCELGHLFLAKAEKNEDSSVAKKEFKQAAEHFSSVIDLYEPLAKLSKQKLPFNTKKFISIYGFSGKSFYKLALLSVDEEEKRKACAQSVMMLYEGIKRISDVAEFQSSDLMTMRNMVGILVKAEGFLQKTDSMDLPVHVIGRPSREVIAITLFDAATRVHQKIPLIQDFNERSVSLFVVARCINIAQRIWKDTPSPLKSSFFPIASELASIYAVRLQDDEEKLEYLMEAIQLMETSAKGTENNAGVYQTYVILALSYHAVYKLYLKPAEEQLKILKRIKILLKLLKSQSLRSNNEFILIDLFPLMLSNLELEVEDALKQTQRQD